MIRVNSSLVLSPLFAKWQFVFYGCLLLFKLLWLLSLWLVQHSPLSRRMPYVAIPGKGVRCLWGQFGMRASPYAPPNIDVQHACMNNQTGPCLHKHCGHWYFQMTALAEGIISGNSFGLAGWLAEEMKQYTRTSIIRHSIIQFCRYLNEKLHPISTSYQSLNNWLLIFY